MARWIPKALKDAPTAIRHAVAMLIAVWVVFLGGIMIWTVGRGVDKLITMLGPEKFVDLLRWP